MHKRVIIFGNGYLEKEYLDFLHRSDTVIGVDRAAYWLIENGIVPDIAIGDFDSTGSHEFKLISEKVNSVKKFSPEKDYTDMELAVKEAVSLNPSEVVLYGGTGSRLDHTLVSVQLLDYFLKRKIKAESIDTHNRVQLVDTVLRLDKSSKYKFVSVLALSDIAVVSLSGFAYNVDKLTIRTGESIGVSNEIKESSAQIVVHSGKIFVIQSRD